MNESKSEFKFVEEIVTNRGHVWNYRTDFDMWFDIALAGGLFYDKNNSLDLVIAIEPKKLSGMVSNYHESGFYVYTKD